MESELETIMLKSGEIEFVIFCNNCNQIMVDVNRIGKWMANAYNDQYTEKYNSKPGSKMPEKFISIMKNAAQLMLIIKHSPDYKKIKEHSNASYI